MIQWYPGHMAKAFREIDENIKFVDCVLVLLDARIPSSSFNPDIIKRCQNKTIIYCLTKADLADSVELNKWLKYYNQLGPTISINTKSNKAKDLLTKTIISALKDKRERDLKKGLRLRAIKTMVLGIPNVGKSTLINTLTGKKVTQIGNKPGVTKAQQWVRINENFELLDTPGVLWPKFENPNVGLNLALVGSIKDDILPIEEVVNKGIQLIHTLYPNRLFFRYQVEEKEIDNYLMALIKEKKIYNNATPNIHKACMMFLNDLRNGLLGPICLDRIEEDEQ